MINGLQRFIHDVGWSFASLAISAVVHFILRIFLARYLGADDLGLYSLSFAAYSFGMVLSGFGIGAALTKYTAQYKGDSSRLRSLLSSGCTISLAIGCLMGVVLYLLSPLIADRFFHMPEMINLLRIVAFVFPFIALQKASLGFLNGLRRMRTFAMINIGQSALTIILTVILVLMGYGLTAAVFSLVLSIAIMSLLSLFSVRGSLEVPRRAQYNSASKMLLSFGIYVMLANGVVLIQIYTSSILLGRFMTAVDVGLYAVAVTLAEAIRLPSQSIQMIVTPTIATYWGNGQIKDIEIIINRIMKYTAAFVIPVIFIIALFSKPLITLIYGDDFTSAGLSLQILLIGTIFAAIQIPVGAALSSTAYVNMSFKLSGISVIINMILNLLLIPRLGITGAATANSTAMVISFLVNLYFIHRLIGIRIHWVWFAKLFVFTALLAGATYWLGGILNFYGSACVALVIYIVVLLKYFTTREDLMLLRRVVTLRKDTH